MTVIVYKDGVLAVDSGCTAGNLLSRVTKWHKASRDGAILTVAGRVDVAHELFAWYEAGAEPESWPDVQTTEDFSVLVVLPTNGQPPCYYESRPWPIPVEDAAAYGSGQDVATGALLFGAKAIEAAHVAAKGCVDCAAPIYWFTAKGEAGVSY